MEEIFKPIENINVLVSNFGNVRYNGAKKNINLNNREGYLFVGINGKNYRVHKLVAEAFIPNPNNKPFVDHIDNNRSNNNMNNLRWATPVENSYNSQLASNNKSGIKGVHFDKPSNKWRAQIQINGKQNHLGYFIDKEDAIKARLKKSIEIQGEFINKCELIQIKRIELDKELEELEREFLELIQ